jgi:hypothetical protein
MATTVTTPNHILFLCTCLFNSSKANYKVSTSKRSNKNNNIISINLWKCLPTAMKTIMGIYCTRNQNKTENMHRQKRKRNVTKKNGTQLYIRRYRKRSDIKLRIWTNKPDTSLHVLLTNSMELSPSWEATTCSATQGFPDILRNPKLHCHVHKIPPLIPILSQIINTFKNVSSQNEHILSIHVSSITQAREAA